MEEKVPYECGFKIGDKVIYKGLIGVVEDIQPVFNYKYWLLDLVSEIDPEMSCTAQDSECELYEGQEIDQHDAYGAAKFESDLTMRVVDKLTDKYHPQH